MNIHILISALALTPLFAMAQSTEPDSIKTQGLDEVVVEARNQRLGAEVSTYIPTSKQRNASQTAAELLNRMRHDEKYLLINQGFAGKQRLRPFFNRQNNDDLILAIQAAGVSRGRNGFRKDKGGEKLAESEEDLLEHRTDGTDAFDTLYIGCEKFPYHDTFALSVSGVS